MKTKEKKLEEKIKILIGIEKLTYTDIEEIIEQMNKKCTTSWIERGSAFLFIF